MKYSLFSKYRTELMGIAMLTILLFHATDIDLGSKVLNEFRAYAFHGVDIFVFLSGIGIYTSLHNKKQTFEEYYGKRILRVMPLAYLIMIPFTIYLILTKGVMWSTLVWNVTLLAYWIRPEGAFNWYVTGIMILYAIALFWKKIFDKAKNKLVITLCGMTAGIGICHILIHDKLWNHLDIFYRIPVFLLGMLIGYYILNDKKISWKKFILYIGMIGVAIIMFYEFMHPPMHTRPVFAFLLLMIPYCLLLCGIIKIMPNFIKKFLNICGKCSLEIYLLNVSLFTLNDEFRTFITFGPTNRLYYLIMFTLNILLGIGLHYAYNKIANKIKNKWRKHA